MRLPFVPSCSGLQEFAFRIRDPTSKFLGFGERYSYIERYML